MKKNGLFLKYFVLNPNKDNRHGKASRKAILEYARIIKSENSKLADDLEKWIVNITYTISNK